MFFCSSTIKRKNDARRRRIAVELVSQEAIDYMALNLYFLFLQKICNQISIEKCKNQLTIFKFSAMI